MKMSRILVFFFFVAISLNCQGQVENPNADVVKRFCERMGETYHYHSDNNFFLYDLSAIGRVDSCNPKGIELNYSNLKHIKNKFEEKKKTVLYTLYKVEINQDTLIYQFDKRSTPKLS